MTDDVRSQKKGRWRKLIAGKIAYGQEETVGTPDLKDRECNKDLDMDMNMCLL